MTAPTEFLEPFAISFKNDPTNGTQHSMSVDQGRHTGNAGRAWLPAASITVTGTSTLVTGGNLRVHHPDGTATVLHDFTTGKIPPVTFSTKAGSYLSILPATIPVGTKAEVLLTVIPMPFSK